MEKYIYQCGCEFEAKTHQGGKDRKCPKCQKKGFHIVKIIRDCRGCGETFITEKKKHTKIYGRKYYCIDCQIKIDQKNRKKRSNVDRVREERKSPFKKTKKKETRPCSCCGIRPVATERGFIRLCVHCFENPPIDDSEDVSRYCGKGGRMIEMGK